MRRADGRRSDARLPREIVARELRWLRHQGILRHDARGHFELLDETKLEELAELPRGDA